MSELNVELISRTANISSPKVHRVWTEAGRILQGIIREAEECGFIPRVEGVSKLTYTLTPTTQTSWRDAKPGAVSIRSIRKHSVRIRIKTGAQDTVWEYDLIPPNGLQASELKSGIQNVIEAGERQAVDTQTPRETNVAQKTAATGDDLSALLEKFTAVAKRQEQRTAEISVCETLEIESRARANKLLADAEAEKATADKYADRIMELMQEEEADTEAQTLKRFAELFQKIPSAP